MTNDEKFDEKFTDFLQREAQSYRAPGEVPREAMWEAIRRQRAMKSRRPQFTSWIGLAATLVIGVAIGRYALTTPAREGSPPAINNVSYGIAAVTHWSKAEALITAYGAAGATPDAQLSAAARDLLSNTRLLLDSPAGVDPVRRKLLQDLELVLVQIVQSEPAAAGADDRAGVIRSLERTHVLERMRASQSAGLNRGT